METLLSWLDVAAAPPTLDALSSALWGCATLGHQHSALEAAIEGVLRRESFRECHAPSPAHVLANACWSAAVLGSQHSSHILKASLGMLATSMVAKDVHPSTGSKVDLQAATTHQMLYQALLLQAAKQGLSATTPNVQRVAGELRVPLICLAVWEEAWKRGVAGGKPSATQCQVASALTACGHTPQLEHVTLDGLFSIDILLPGPPEIGVEVGGRAALRGGRRVCSAQQTAAQQLVFIAVMSVQVDGPPHFCASPADMRTRPVGATLARRRLLASRGVRCVSVDTRTWHHLAQGRDPSHAEDRVHTAAQLRWLQQLLAAAQT
jgi:hypothetical protein